MTFGELQYGKESARFFDGKLRNLGDRFSRYSDGTGLRAQTSPATFRAGRIATEAAEEHAYVQLVFLALQVLEEAAHAPELLVALNNPALLLGLEIGLPMAALKKPIQESLTAANGHHELRVSATNRLGKAFTCRVQASRMTGVDGGGVIVLMEVAEPDGQH